MRSTLLFIALLLVSCSTLQTSGARSIVSLLRVPAPVSRERIEQAIREPLAEQPRSAEFRRIVYRPLQLGSPLRAVHLELRDKRPHSESLDQRVLRAILVLDLSDQICITISELESALGEKISRSQYADLHRPSILRDGPPEIQSINGSGTDAWLTYVHVTQATLHFESSRPRCLSSVDLFVETRVR